MKTIDKYNKFYIEGKTNHSQGKHVNPYPRKSEAYLLWGQGWLAAQHEKSPANGKPFY